MTLAPDDAALELLPQVDGRDVVLREIRARRGQQRFRDELLRCYSRRCVISGCDIVDRLEAAHIRPYRGLAEDNDPSNGLLLRCDLHTLFDLDLLGIVCERDARVQSPWALMGPRMFAGPAVFGRRYRELDDPFTPLLAVLCLGCRLHAFSREAATFELHPL